MKTTLELDDALDARLRDTAHRHGWSFKETVAKVLRAGLDHVGPKRPGRKHRWHMAKGPLLVDILDRDALEEALGPPELP